MRLERLEIGGFGALSGFAIDLHPRITVVIGENESGKSTVHRALRAALYGVDAGGPGRPTERSEWSRWSPWNGSTYSVALTYSLADGRRLRVARRLESRDQACQVIEIGGRDVTDELRVGRTVAPGQVHLGIDEAVFCASACVGDDGLRLGATDAPASRAARVQEAIERLADSGSSTTATEALAALQEAARRVGSERRPTSPLGHAVNRLRQLDLQVQDARQRLAALGAEEERLRRLEADAAAAEGRRADAERRWLLGRLAALAAQREELQATSGELVHLAAEIEGNAHLASFPLEQEDRVVSLAAEVHEAQRAADEAAARAAAAAVPLGEVRRRRAEISGGTRALAGSPAVGPAAAVELEELRDQLAAAEDGRRHGREVAASVARRDALRREIASTGLAGISPSRVENAIELAAVARRGRSRRPLRWAGPLLVGAGAAGAVAAAAGHQAAAGAAAAVLVLVGALLTLGLGRVLGDEGARARQRLERLCPGAALDDAGLDILAARLPRLRALHDEVQREEVRLETLTGAVDEAESRLRSLAARAAAVAAEHGVRWSPPASGGDPPELQVRAVLDAFTQAAAVQQRRRELAVEDTNLAQRQAELEVIGEEAVARAQAVVAARARLSRLLAAAGIEPRLPGPQAVATFRAACAGRRRHAAALRRREELARSAATRGDGASQERLRVELEARLVARGGDPGEVSATAPLSPAELQELERAADHARQGAVSALTSAAQLRARLGEMRSNAPPLADLEDERAACAAARDRGLRQLAALRRAGELVDAATRGVHRDLAPRLAGSVADRLALLTEGRYSAVNVDTAHFAVSLLGRDRPDLVPLDLLSHGTRDQVSLLLRLALAEVLSGGGEPVPLLLDEPLLSADPQRRGTALRFLWNLSATNQVVLSTSDPSLLDALGDCCDGERPGVAVMPPPTGALETMGRVVSVARLL